ncbi:MAG: TonB-dependent receptor [Acidobacteriaceae bacterium]|nr:TonB-dependent receptor [Acidobacteriaceae bacterium]
MLRLVSALLLFLLPVLPLAGQSTFGEIRGLIKDTSGALVAKADVKATRTSTGESRKVKTNESGTYVLANLDAGEWEVLVEKVGFRPATTKGIALRARETVRVDLSLEIGQVVTEVQVVAQNQVVQTDMATVMDSKSADALTKLPVNYRAGATNTFYAIISTAPGVQPDSSGNYSVGGGMPFQTTASVDGISNINVRSNGVLTEMFPSADTVDEVRVSSTSNNAEFAQAGDITVTSKSGTNRFRGSAYWYHQNGAFDARDFFASRTPFKVSNDFGVAGGGPIVKNRTFFFGALESLRYRAQRVINATVPTANFRGGNFSSLTNVALRDPFNGNAPFAGNLIPASRINPVSKGLADALFPNATRAGDVVSAPNYSLLKGSANDNDQYDVRVDHNFSEKHRVFGRYSQKEITRTAPKTFFDTTGDAVSSANPKNLVGAWNHIIRANLLNEVRGGFATQDAISTFGLNGKTFDGPALLKQVGMQGIRNDPPAGSQIPNIQINGFTSTGEGRESVTRSRNLQFSDNLTWIKGRHTYKFGADIRRLRTTDITSFTTGDDMGEYSFNGQYTGYGVADYLLGVPNATVLANTGRDVDGVTVHYGFYAQDDFKVNSKLTVNFGVRYEIHPMFYDNALTTTQFDRAFPGGRIVLANEAAKKFTAPTFLASIGNTPVLLAKDVGLPERLRLTDYNNFAPRFGFAWRPFGNKTVIRGGYGIFTSTILGSVFYTISGIHVSDVRTFPNALTPAGVPELVFPRPFRSGLGAGGGRPDFRRATQWDGPDPYTQQWSLTLERELPYQIGVRLSYTGSKAIKLFSSPDLNQVRPNTIGYAAAAASRPYPNWQIVYSRDPNTQSFFNSGTAEVNKRYSNGLFFQTSWVWAHGTSNATGSNGGGFAAENGAVPTDRFNLALDKGNLPGTRRHRSMTTATYELPFGKWAGDNPVSKRLLEGWQISGIFLWQTGLYLTPTTGNVTDPSGTALNTRATNRPDYTGTSYGNLASGVRTVDRWFDGAAFSVPGRVNGVNLPNNGAIGRFGYVGPGSLVGPRTAVLSAKIQKQIAITERVFIQLEGAASNLGNTPNFGNPQLNITNAQFGRITATQGQENAGARSLQVGLRLGF